jgi:NAD(P)-dependent dehydrogenase (short-subunit alcohol dehydrogenase family)
VRTAVVTGAASGIGRALTELLAAGGFTVYASDIQPNNGAHGLVRPVTADVSRPADMDRLAQEASDVEMVCLNAGIVGTSMGAPWEAPLEEWNRVLSVNLLGVVNGLRAFVPRLLRRAQPGHILITASLAGLVTFPAGGAYAASKHALVAVAEQASLALASSPVDVTLLCPSLVRTGMSPEGADPMDVARTALDACRHATFAVVELEWAGTVAARGEALAAGARPEVPAPRQR